MKRRRRRRRPLTPEQLAFQRQALRTYSEFLSGKKPCELSSSKIKSPSTPSKTTV